LDVRLSGPQSWSGCSGEEKNSQPLSEFEHLIIQAIAQHYTTELSWLLNIYVYFMFIMEEGKTNR
jgi:hypothetical protein